MTSCGSIAIGFRFLAVADLISLIGKVYEPSQERTSNQTKNPIFSYVI